MAAFEGETIGKYKFALLKIHVDLTEKLSSNLAISYFDCLPLRKINANRNTFSAENVKPKSISECHKEIESPYLE